MAHGFSHLQLCQNILARGCSRLVSVECSCGEHLSRSGLSWNVEHLCRTRLHMLRGRGCGLDLGRVARSHVLVIMFHSVGCWLELFW